MEIDDNVKFEKFDPNYEKRNKISQNLVWKILILYEKNCSVLLSTIKNFQTFRSPTMEVPSKNARDFQKE